jgi:hypothetical protein
MSKCANCGRVLESEEEKRIAFDNYYCERCYDTLFASCSRCDMLIYDDEARYDNGGYCFCESCWEHENGSDIFPQNPEVGNLEREQIVNLSRNWLNGNVDYRTLIRINQRDYFLKTIQEKVGLVDKKIYCFGLIDRDEFQLRASSEIFEQVKEFIYLRGLYLIVEEVFIPRKLGISYSLRENNQDLIVELIREISTEKEVEKCAA